MIPFLSTTFLIAEVPAATGADDAPGLEVSLPGGALARAMDSSVRGMNYVKYSN